MVKWKTQLHNNNYKIFKQLCITTIITIISISCLLPHLFVLALPQGAPLTVCDTMQPFHGGGILAQDSLPPFKIELSTTILNPGQSMYINLIGLPNGLTFGGFMLQARNRQSPYDIIGHFKSTGDSRSQLMNCNNVINSSITHTNPGPKSRVTIEWQSPNDFEGEINFKATVAQTYDTFWVNFPSETLRIIKRDLSDSTIQTITTRNNIFTTNTTGRTAYIPKYIPTTPSAKSDDPFYRECGIGKNCFGVPDGCVNDKSCNLVTGIKVRGDIYEFEIKSTWKDAAFIAMALSEDNKMGDDLVTECVSQNGDILMYTSYTSAPPKSYGASRSGVPQNTARLVESSIINGAIYCKIIRDQITKVDGKIFDLVNNKYHLLIAAGRNLKENGVGYHDIVYMPSQKSLKLALVESKLEGASNLFYRLHGAFMIVAWIGTTSLGIVLARYYKQTWSGSHLFGKDQWFVWHFTCMATTWCLTMAAFILIFIELGRWSAENNPHAILGLITTIICFIQPIGAFFRPSPNAKSRPIFNWLHWLGGNTAHLLAIITIFFAVKLTKAQLPEWMDWILVAYVAFHVIVHLLLSIASCASDRKQSDRINVFQMGDISHQSLRNSMKMERNKEAPYSLFRKGILAIYMVGLIILVIILVLIIVLAPIEESFQKLQDALN